MCIRDSRRVDQMMQEGLLEEVRSVLPYRHLNSLNTVGYKELFKYLDGEDVYKRQAFMDGDIQDCIDHLIVAENAERLKESEL